MSKKYKGFTYKVYPQKDGVWYDIFWDEYGPTSKKGELFHRPTSPFPFDHEAESHAKKVIDNYVKEYTKTSDRLKYNPNGDNTYTTPKIKPIRYDLRRKHKTLEDPLDKADRKKEKDMSASQKDIEVAKKLARVKIAAKNEAPGREGIESFQFKDSGLKAIAQTYKHLAAAFLNIVKANNVFTSIKSSQISPDGKLGGRGYIQPIKDIRNTFATTINSMSELIDTFYDEVNSPYWKKTTLEDHPAVKDILSEADTLITQAEGLEDKVESSTAPTAELSKEEKEKVVSLLKSKNW